MFLSGCTCVIVTRFLESVLIERALLDVDRCCALAQATRPLLGLRAVRSEYSSCRVSFSRDRHVHVLHGRSRHEVTRMRRSLLALFCGSACWVLILCSAVYQSFGRTRSSSGSCLLGATTRDHFAVSNGLPRTGSQSWRHVSHHRRTRTRTGHERHCRDHLGHNPCNSYSCCQHRSSCGRGTLNRCSVQHLEYWFRIRITRNGDLACHHNGELHASLTIDKIPLPGSVFFSILSAPRSEHSLLA